MELPKDNGFQPDDVDLLIKHVGKPLPKERKAALMQKLQAERDKSKNAQDQEADQSRDNDQEQSR